ncbi:hypothetical protein [Microcoleus phage My-WqHQDG]|nr:hypothetical protein [Microcoleus phage My-WqHQDG]
MQSVGLISSSTHWNSNTGVITKIEVDVGKPLPVEYCAPYPDLSLIVILSIRIQGINTPVITVKGDEVAINRFAVHQWLDSNNVLTEWYEEAARYRATLERVNLPCRFTQVYDLWLPTPLDEKSFTYKLYMTHEGYNVHLTVMVAYDKTAVSVTLAPDNRRRREVAVGECTITGPVNVDTIREAVRPALDEFIGKLRGLVEQPMMEDVPYS